MFLRLLMTDGVVDKDKAPSAGRAPMVNTGDQIGAGRPVRVGKIPGRGKCRMIGVRMVETDNLTAGFTAVALNTEEVGGIDLVLALRFVRREICARDHRMDVLIFVPIDVTDENAT